MINSINFGDSTDGIDAESEMMSNLSTTFEVLPNKLKHSITGKFTHLSV